eukprot:239401_1
MSDAVVSRLEAVAARLERVASKLGGGGGDDDDEVPMWVSDYEAIVNKEVKDMVAKSKAIGLETPGDLVLKGYQNTLSLVKRAPNCKKPAPQEMQAFLKPGIEAIGALDNLRYKAKDVKTKGDHYKAFYEAIMVISWVTMAPPAGLPKQHVESQVGSCDFNLNRVLKNNKGEDTKAWIQSVKALNKKVAGYVKEYFKQGLIWNPKGTSLSDAKEASSGGAEEKKDATAAKSSAKKKKAGGGMNAVFGQLSKGLDVTKGMKKVTKGMKTKNRKDRSGKVSSSKKAGPKKRKKFGPPQCKFMGGRMMVENYEEENGLVTVDKIDVKSNVFVTMCDGCTVQINKKVKAITIDNCVKVRVFVQEVVSTVEVVNCKSVKIIVVDGGKVPSFAVDKCESPAIILSKSAYEAHPDIYTSNVSAMNVEVVGETDNKEYAIPEQFLTKIDPKTGKCTTTQTEH